MNILFLTLVKINSLDERGIYTDLLREFRKNGHQICVVTPTERRNKKSTHLVSNEGTDILHVKTFNIQKTNMIEKGFGTLAIENQFLRSIKKHFPAKKFDLVLYSTPPITFSKIIKYIKERDNAFSYLLLKDIFPQNAVDMKMLKANGILHRFFQKKEKTLYELSDFIGCMSDENVKYLLEHNSFVDSKKVEVNPNSIEPLEIKISHDDKISVRKKYGIPIESKVLVYGGNLGKPQGLDFLLETIKKCSLDNVHFLVIGSGTEYSKIQNWFLQVKPQNATLLEGLPKKEYDNLLISCDVGLIFLHKDFTIPNFPSRLLSYLEMKIPIIAATDVNTDIGKVIETAKCGYWSETGDLKKILENIERLISDENLFEKMRQNSIELLNKNFTVDLSYQLIVEKVLTDSNS